MERHFKLDEVTLEYIDCTYEVKHQIRQWQIYLSVMTLLFAIALICSISYIYHIEALKLQIEFYRAQETKAELAEGVDLNLLSVDRYIDGLPFKDKSFVKRQYRLESARLKSNLVKTHKNLFGMKNACGKRKKCQLGINGGDYRKYHDWRHSVHDRLAWEQEGGNLKIYAEDQNYFRKLAKK